MVQRAIPLWLVFDFIASFHFISKSLTDLLSLPMMSNSSHYGEKKGCDEEHGDFQEHLRLVHKLRSVPKGQKYNFAYIENVADFIEIVHRHISKEHAGRAVLLPQRSILRSLLRLPNDALASIPKSDVSIISKRTRRILNHVKEHCNSLALTLENDRKLLQDQNFAIHDDKLLLQPGHRIVPSSTPSTAHEDDEETALNLAALTDIEVQELDKDPAILVHELLERFELAITLKIFNSGLIRKRLDALGELSKAMYVAFAILLS